MGGRWARQTNRGKVEQCGEGGERSGKVRGNSVGHPTVARVAKGDNGR